MKLHQFLVYSFLILLLSCDTEPFPSFNKGGQVWSAANINVETSKANQNISENCEEYGRLYTYDAALEVAAMYPSWRLPTLAEAQRLANYYEGNLTAFVEGFNCIGGYSSGIRDARQFDGGGFWTSTVGGNGNIEVLFAGEGHIVFDEVNKNNFISVRLIKDTD